MQNINWAICCRFNQARSIVAAAMLRKHFPDIQVTSFGIEAIDRQPIPKSVAEIAQLWNLAEYDRTSKKFDNNWFRSNQCDILAADNFVKEVLTNTTYSTRISSMTEFETSDNLLPIDPTGLNRTDLAKELAKVLLVTMRWASKQLSNEARIISLYYSNGNDHYIELELEKYPEDSVFIDVNFNNPLKFVTTGEIELERFNLRDLASFNLRNETLKHVILSSKFETDSPESVFTSVEWRNFVMRIAGDRPTHLVSSFGSQEIAHSPTPLLSLLNSDSTILLN